MFTSDRTIKWIENLAEQELSIRAGERVSIDLASTMDEVLTAETGGFIGELTAHCRCLVELFNQRVNQSALPMTPLRFSDSPSGLTVTRNDMRVSLSATRPGVIQVQCHKIILDPSQTRKTIVMFSGLIEARFEPFHDVEWYFVGNRISAEQVARHYLTEFIQATRLISETE
jgi:hypothetical protein